VKSQAHGALALMIYLLIPLYTLVPGFDFDIDMMWTWIECGCESLMFMGVKRNKEQTDPT